MKRERRRRKERRKIKEPIAWKDRQRNQSIGKDKERKGKRK